MEGVLWGAQVLLILTEAALSQCTGDFATRKRQQERVEARMGEGIMRGRGVRWVIPTRKEVHRSTSSVFLAIFLKWPNSHNVQLVHSESQYTSQLMWVLSNPLDHLSF